MNEKQKEQDELVRNAETLVRQLIESGEWNKDVGRTQASRAIEVAQAADSLRLFVNWLRYQTARESDRQPFWSAKAGQKMLSESLTAELNNIQRAQADAMPRVRLFLGYFRRALIGADFLARIKMEVE